MELFKTNFKTKMILAAVIEGQTKFLRFSGVTDPYNSDISYAAKYGNKPDFSLIDATFSFEDQENAILFEELSYLINVIEYDNNNSKKLQTLLTDNGLVLNEVVIQNIKGTDVFISPINLETLFSHLQM
jgi:hypothetical protein